MRKNTIKSIADLEKKLNINPSTLKKIKINKFIHYTNEESFSYIYNKNRWSLKLTRVDYSNDMQELNKIEQQLNEEYKKIYVFCMSANVVENVHMWAMYGGKKIGQKCRLEFPAVHFAEQIKEKKYKVYTDSSLEEQYLLDEKEYSLKLSYVAYVCGKKEYDDEYDTVVLNNTVYATDLTKDIFYKKESAVLAGKIKNQAWQQEKEVRIIVKLKNVNDDFTSLFIKMEDDGEFKSETIFRTGPWTNKAMSTVESKGLLIRNSYFYNLLNNFKPCSMDDCDIKQQLDELQKTIVIK